MNGLLHFATAELAEFLNDKLPELSKNWWQECVVDQLSYPQQRIVWRKGFRTLQQLDFAALLRIMDKNWYELSFAFNLPREGRNWVKELQMVRNNWAHLGADDVQPSEAYRDADTLGRLLVIIGASQTSIKVVEEIKVAALAAMTNASCVCSEGTHAGADIPKPHDSDLTAREPEKQSNTSASVNELVPAPAGYDMMIAEVWRKAVTLAMLSTLQKARPRSAM